MSDPAGNLVAFLRMPGAFPQSIRIAIDKATTAGGFGFSTAKWMAVCGDDEGMKLGFASQPGVIVFAGGLPIRSEGQLIGGIGVSGPPRNRTRRARGQDCSRSAPMKSGIDGANT